MVDAHLDNVAHTGPRPDADNPDFKAQDVASAQELIEYVSDDKGRAQEVLDSEQALEAPRTSVTEPLQRILNEDTGAGIASGQA